MEQNNNAVALVAPVAAAVDAIDIVDTDITFVPSSGNIFADLGLPDAEELDAKASLAQVIRERIREQKLTQAQAAERMGATQSIVSQIINARIDRFTYDRLLKFIGALDCDVEITIKPKAKQTTTVAVYATC